MKADTKKMVVTVVNIIIFVCNAIVSFLGNGGDISQVATVTSGIFTALA